MALRDIFGKTISEWMKGTGPERDIALGSRVRLARNLAGVPFPAVAGNDHLQQVKDLAGEVVAREDGLGALQFMPMEDMNPLERRLLVERHLISPQHTQDVKQKALILRDDEAVSILVNEEDHLRIQALFPGLQPNAAWELCNQVDDLFEGHLDYAFAENRGYLTACPTNAGTGLRASIMVHLPALTMAEQMQRVVGAVAKFGLVVRGLYGEGTEVVGNIFQLSNQVTLGHTESEIIQHLVTVTRQVIDQERQARQHVLNRGKLQLEDRVHRSYGVLATARVMTTREAMQLLSDLRLGIDLGIITGLEGSILQELLVMIRPAHLQRLVDRELEAPERDQYRAKFIRERLQRVGA